jgi:tRNA pseudouridine38-40 synthase
VYKSFWKQHGDLLVYNILADRFLHTMIRSLVGCMVEAGSGRKSIRQFRDIFKSGNHTLIKRVGPARGLFLIAVGY